MQPTTITVKRLGSDTLYQKTVPVQNNRILIYKQTAKEASGG
jgi:hypothetical protein